MLYASYEKEQVTFTYYLIFEEFSSITSNFPYFSASGHSFFFNYTSSNKHYVYVISMPNFVLPFRKTILSFVSNFLS